MYSFYKKHPFTTFPVIKLIAWDKWENCVSKQMLISLFSLNECLGIYYRVKEKFTGIYWINSICSSIQLVSKTKTDTYKWKSATKWDHVILASHYKILRVLQCEVESSDDATSEENHKLLQHHSYATFNISYSVDLPFWSAPVPVSIAIMAEHLISMLCLSVPYSFIEKSVIETPFHD